MAITSETIVITAQTMGALTRATVTATEAGVYQCSCKG